MTGDPHPEWRCRCIGYVTVLGAPDPFENRCPARPSQEDQFCDHCRDHCQRQEQPRSVPLLTPCALLEVPF